MRSHRTCWRISRSTRDFAQVEADEQQVNLTRFSLFFPEKREFFLENQGMFAFGGLEGARATAGDAPLLFYSRRLGLAQGREVPIRGGARLTGRVGRFSLGALNIQADDQPAAALRATNFTVLRIKRDILRRGSIGAIFAGRSVAETGDGSNETYGIDGTLSFFANLHVNTYWARTDTDSRPADDTSYRAQLDYAGDRYGLQLEHLLVGRNFNPELGFLRRNDIRKNFGQLRFSPRPRTIKSVRKYSGTASIDYIEHGAGRLDTRQIDGAFAIEFQNSDRVALEYSNTYEFLQRFLPHRANGQSSDRRL